MIMGSMGGISFFFILSMKGFWIDCWCFSIFNCGWCAACFKVNDRNWCFDLLMYMPLLLMGKPQALLLLLGQQNHHNQLHNLLGQQLLDLLLDLELLPCL